MTKLTYTVPEACSALSISKTTLYKQVALGNLELVKIGARSLIRADQVHAMARGGLA